MQKGVSVRKGFHKAFLQAEEKSKKEKFTMSVACSDDGKKIACGSQDGTVCIFDSETGSLLHSLEGHYKPVRSLSFTPGASSLPLSNFQGHSRIKEQDLVYLQEGSSLFCGLDVSAIFQRDKNYVFLI